MARLKRAIYSLLMAFLSNHELKEPPCKAAFLFLANITLDLRGSSIIPLDPLVFDDHYPRIGNTGVYFDRGFTSRKNTIIHCFSRELFFTGVYFFRYPITIEDYPRQGVGAARSAARTRPLERHSYQYPMEWG